MGCIAVSLAEKVCAWDAWRPWYRSRYWGVKVSGGQRQRLANCARLLRDPKILMLDEANGQLRFPWIRSNGSKSFSETLMEGRTTSSLRIVYYNCRCRSDLLHRKRTRFRCGKHQAISYKLRTLSRIWRHNLIKTRSVSLFVSFRALAQWGEWTSSVVFVCGIALLKKF